MNGKNKTTMPKKFSDLTKITALENTSSFLVTDPISGSDRRITRSDLKKALGVSDLESSAFVIAESYDTLTTLESDVTQDEGTVANVTSDPNNDNNGFYRFNGSVWQSVISFLSGLIADSNEATNSANVATDNAIQSANTANSAAQNANEVAESVGSLDTELRDLQDGFRNTLVVKDVQNDFITVFATTVTEFTESRTINGVTYTFPSARITTNY